MKTIIVVICMALLSGCTYHQETIINIDRTNFDIGYQETIGCTTDSDCQEKFGGDGGPGN